MDYQLSPLEVKIQQDVAAFCRTEMRPGPRCSTAVHARRQAHT